MTKSNNFLLWERAQRVLPGGVNSPVRSFSAVGGNPRFIASGEGPFVWDIEGHRYVDYVLSWGALALGHAHPGVVEAVVEAARKGSSFGACCQLEVELAELLVEAFPSVEMVRLVNSGTEATMSALRLARAFTGREKVVKFAGAYHGHADAFLVKAGSGSATLSQPDSPGVPVAVAENTIIVPYNDLEAVELAFLRHKNEIAAVIAEPIMANMGFIRPKPGFLKAVQDLCRTHGSLFVLDEVITGMRVDLRGAQGLWGLDPDLTCMGKVIGGGFPLAAYGGRRSVMQLVSPSGPVYQAGTLAGNPVACAAGIATLRCLSEEGVFARTKELTARLAAGICEQARRFGINLQADHEGTILGLFFLRDGAGEIVDYETCRQWADPEQYALFFRAMLERGFLLAPSQFEVAFLSSAHDEQIIGETLEAAAGVFAELAERAKARPVEGESVKEGN